MKYIIYARKSTEEDDRQVLSIEAQLVELKEFAAKPSEARNGLTPVKNLKLSKFAAKPLKFWGACRSRRRRRRNAFELF